MPGFTRCSQKHVTPLLLLVRLFAVLSQKFFEFSQKFCPPTILSGLFGVLSQSFLNFCKNFVPYYTFWTFLRLHKIKFYVFSNFYGNSSPLLFIGQLSGVLIGFFAKKFMKIHPPTIPCPTFSRFDRLIFKILPKVKAPSRFRDGAPCAIVIPFFLLPYPLSAFHRISYCTS